MKFLPKLLRFVLPVAFLELHFGGDSDSQANTTSQQFDQRATTGNGGLATSGSNNVITISSTTTDLEAVKRGTDLAGKAVALSIASAADTANQVKAIASDAMGRVAGAYETAKAGDQREVSMVAMAAVVIVAVVAAPAIFRSR